MPSRSNHGCNSFAAGYLPCDPNYPDDRLAIYLEDANATVLLTEPQHYERGQGLVGPTCPVLNVADACVQPLSGAALGRRCSADDPCYMIFTSGSTGRPKGCMLPHRGVQDLLPWLVELHDLSESRHPHTMHGQRVGKC